MISARSWARLAEATAVRESDTTAPGYCTRVTLRAHASLDRAILCLIARFANNVCSCARSFDVPDDSSPRIARRAGRAGYSALA
jgi:hypothetical protein